MIQKTMLARARMLGACALVASCGSAPAETHPPVPAGAEALGPPRPGEWVTWSHEQKASYMKKAVLPRMGRAFSDFDATMFPGPNCTLCHAAGAKDRSFKMPDVGLPPLPSTPAALKAVSETEPGLFQFMARTVVPETAALLGQPPYDPATGQGFGCFNCHTKM